MSEAPSADQAAEDLNPEQRSAVRGAGPLLVLAGAGSGKTRVITQRIARIIDAGADPRRVIAVTFTNKAAGEMRQRVHRLLGGDPRGLFLGTFHAWGLRLLRRHGEAIGLGRGFAIYDRGDQLELIKRVLAARGIDEAQLSPRRALDRISRARSRLGVDEEYGEIYESALRATGAVDFDDLIALPLRLLRADRELAERIRPEHLLVDEFQDTSPAQNAILELLWPSGGDVCVVGDEDQAIYGFRGATVSHILAFNRSHADATIVRLTRNYRSTAPILEAASALVANNRERLGKKLVSEVGAGDPIDVVRCASPEAEADEIVVRARRALERHGAGEVAVLYRTNAQSRSIEECFVRAGVPYRLVKGQRFYDRREVKDVLAYLRLIANPDDDGAFDRIVNVPARGIGAAARDEIEAVARREPSSRARAAEVVARGTSAAGRRVRTFVELMARLRRGLAESEVEAVIADVLKLSGYGRMLEKADAEGEGEKRLDNVTELLRKAEMSPAGRGADALRDFLDDVAISAEPEIGPGAVLLMTLHNAKGLEFQAVLIAGLEEGLLPHAGPASQAWGGEEEVEEERRLLYVGMTRAARHLTLTLAPGRRLWNDGRPSRPSRFLDELPREHLRRLGEPPPPEVTPHRPTGGGVRRTSARPVTAPAKPRPKPGAGAEEGGGGALAVGAWVHHQKYGDGMILESEGSGDQLKLTVRFSSGMRKKLVARYARLTPLKRRR